MKSPRGFPAGALALALASWAAGGASPARALFIGNEMDVIDAETRMDAEYLLDVTAFSYPLDWSWEWASGGTGYRINAASVDATDLILEQRGRFRRRLLHPSTGSARAFDFRYDLVQEADKDVEQIHHWIALETGPGPRLSFGLFGEPTPAKEDADIGALLRVRPRDDVRLLATANAVDWNMNQRSRSGHRYARKPYAFEGSVEWRRDPDRLSLSLEHDTPLTRLDPARGLSYRYRRTAVTAAWELPAAPIAPPGPWATEDPSAAPPPGPAPLGWRAALGYEFKREGQDLVPDTRSLSSDFRRDAWRLQGAAAINLAGATRLETGAWFIARSARLETPTNPLDAVSHRRWELQPYARVRRLWRPWALLEGALFTSFGELRRHRVTSPDELTGLAEAKAGLGIDFLFGPRGRIGVYGAFDLDDAAQHLWDGGNMRAQLLF